MKIAVVGSAETSKSEAPYPDPSWEIWGCSMANQDLPRVDRWYETHSTEIMAADGTYTPYLLWMQKQKLVYLPREHARFKNSRAIEYRALIKRFGRYPWKSTVSYMLGDAIMELEALPEGEERVLGIWGIEMSSYDEYGYQRLACQTMIQVAMDAGITVVTPINSSIAEPGPMYGVCENSRLWSIFNARKITLEKDRNALVQRIESDTRQRIALDGMIEQLEWDVLTFGRETVEELGYGADSDVQRDRRDNALWQRRNDLAASGKDNHDQLADDGGRRGDVDDHLREGESIGPVPLLVERGDEHGRDSGHLRPIVNGSGGDLSPQPIDGGGL